MNVLEFLDMFKIQICKSVIYVGESGAGSPPLSLAGVILKLMKRES